MSVFEDLKKENLLTYALQGVRRVIEEQLDLPSLVITVSENYKQELIRRAQNKEKIAYPLAYLAVNSIAAIKDQQNNVAMRKHGIHVQSGDRATAKKAYVFPLNIGLELHYVDSEPNRILMMAQMLALLSATNGCKFVLMVGDLFEYHVTLEVPTDTAINIQEEQSSSMPGATEIVANLIMRSQVGFFRDVAAVNGAPVTMVISVENGDKPIHLEV